MTTDYIEENHAERERLRALIGRLSDADLERHVYPEWTIAGVLGHVAFWDARILRLLDKWESGRAQPSRADGEPEDIDWVNDASRDLIHAIPPRRCVELALRLADETDRRVANLSPALIKAIADAGQPISFFRSAHRREHLDEIETFLQRAR